MLDDPTKRLPTAAEREVWAFDLAKRMICDGRDDRLALLEQGTTTVLEYAKGATRDQETQD